ncbi:hypothetical protein RDABS01_007333 [Bienertia sinuspersici]
MTLNYDEGNPLADMTQSVVVVPELLLNNLDYVDITGLQGNNDKVNLVGYILKNATLKMKMLELGRNTSSIRLVLGFQQHPQ